MCGILFCASSPGHSIATVFERLCQVNSSRGPDAQRTYQTSYETPSSGAIDLRFFASELHLRGDVPISQPHLSPNGTVLCYNGEVFDGMDVAPTENDGVKLFEVLCQTTSETQVLEVFSRIEGPYAFVLYHSPLGCIFFGRDLLGRRSLLIHLPSPTQQYLILSSVSAGVDVAYDFEEVSTAGIFQLKLSSFCIDQTTSLPVLRYPTQISINQVIPPSDWPRAKSLGDIPLELQPVVDELLHRLDKSVLQRVRDIPSRSTGAKVAVLFSGGIDSTVIAALADRHVPVEEPIDLLNVAFENPRKVKIQREGNSGRPTSKKKKKPTLSTEPVVCSYKVPDRVTGAQELEELRGINPKRIWNFVEVNVPFERNLRLRASTLKVCYCHPRL